MKFGEFRKMVKDAPHVLDNYEVIISAITHEKHDVRYKEGANVIAISHDDNGVFIVPDVKLQAIELQKGYVNDKEVVIDD